MKALLKPSTAKFAHALVDTSIWYTYLLCLICVSFINETFPGDYWLLVTFIVFALGALTAISIISGGRGNWSALSNSRMIILVFGLMLVWLCAQQFLPHQTEIHQLILETQSSGTDQPGWYAPLQVLSVVPSNTRLLLQSEVLMFGIFVLSIVLVCSRRRVIQLTSVIMAVGLIHAVIGIVSKYAGISLVDLKALDGHFSAARAWFINRNHFAAFISLTLFAGLVLQLRLLTNLEGKRISSVLVEQFLSVRVLYLFAISLGVVALILSQSRAGFLAIFVSLVLVTLSVGKKSSRFAKRRAIILPALIIALVALAYLGSDLLARFSGDQSFLGERAAQWHITLEAIKGEPLLGYGGNSYQDVFQIMRGYADFRQVVFDQAHNDYLHILLEQGLIGLSLWLALLVLCMRNGLQAFSQSSSSLVSAVMMASLVVIIAALMQSLVDFNLHILNIRYYFFVIMSLMLSVPLIKQRKGKPKQSFLV